MSIRTTDKPPKPWHAEVQDSIREAENAFYVQCQAATWTTRLSAATLDLIFTLVVATGTKRLLSLIALPFFDRNLPFPLSYLWLSLYALTYLVIQIAPTVIYGASPGKLLMGIRVLSDPLCNPLPISRLFFREVILKSILGPLSLGISIIVGFRRENCQTLHDALSKSVVKNVRG